MRVVFVHGACVTDGEWWWHRAARLLESRGTRSVSPVLPSCGEAGEAAGANGPGLDADVAAVREELQRDDEPTVLVAHSYGGIVSAEAAAGIASVRHLLLISSYLPEVGESLASFAGPEPAPFLDIDPVAGTLAVRPELLAETFLHDCPEFADDARRRLAPQTLSITQQPVRAAAWHEIPTTYLICSADRGTPAERQRAFAARADTVVECDAGHHPFLSQPETVVDLVASVQRSC